MSFLSCPSSDSETLLPEIYIHISGTDIPSGTGSYDFGDVHVDGDDGVASSDITFTIENIGTADISISSMPYFQVTPPISI